jgi:phospholipid/cholesterol/gamma-HCH transport system substrate-binding protein
MKSLRGPIIKSTVFIAVTLAATTVLALTITNGTVGSGHSYTAIFTDATSLNSGDDIRMAGVRIGQVSSVGLTREDGQTEAKVHFTVESDVALAKTVSATIRFRNLIGQRYIELDEGSGSLSDPIAPGATLGTDATHPALDLTELFNGFQPLFRALEPDEINELSGEIIEVFQGEGPTVQDLLAQTGSLTTTLADKDAVLGKVIDNLSTVVTTINARGTELSTTLSTLRQLVAGLTADRTSIGTAISGISNLTTDVGSVLSRGRAPLQQSISALGTLSSNLAGSDGALNSFLQRLPTKLSTIGRLASYGSWLNFYLCEAAGRFPTGGYFGSVGAKPVEARCQG